MLTFRMGNPEQPRGHALLFFRDADSADQIWATYLVVAPIAMDLAKYIPAAFAPQLGSLSQESGPTAYPLPPMPEKIDGGLARLEHWARLRGDDLLDGGTLRVADAWQAMHPVADVGRQYAQAWERYAAATAPGDAELDDEAAVAIGSGSASFDVDGLLLQVMPDAEKVSRLARLAGTLRYATDGRDERQAAETVREMEQVGRYLADKYRVPELVVAARSTEPGSAELAQLYLERCYKLAEEDYAALPAIEERIASLQAQSAPE